jgi:GGDEF domain-containing protein
VIARPFPTASTIDSWFERLGTDGLRPDWSLADAAVDLVETMSERPDGTLCALDRFGAAAGNGGWPIGQVMEWLTVLATLVPRRHRKALTGLAGHSSVAQGWAEGFVRGAHSGMCVDPTTGLVTAMVLRLRLREVYEQCSALELPVSDRYTLIVIDSDTAALPRLQRDLMMASVADAVRQVFQHGETIARAGDRVIVLAANTPATDERAAVLADRLWLTAGTRPLHATMLFDAPPREIDELDRYLRDLVG